MNIRPGLPAPPHSAPRNLTLSIEVSYAFALAQTEDENEGLRWARLTRDELADRFDQGLDMPHEHYEMARVLAMLGEDAEAVEKLDEAIEKGWRSWTFAFDPVIDSLRKRADFKEIEARYNADIARMLAVATTEPGAQAD